MAFAPYFDVVFFPMLFFLLYSFLRFLSFNTLFHVFFGLFCLLEYYSLNLCLYVHVCVCVCVCKTFVMYCTFDARLFVIIHSYVRLRIFHPGPTSSLALFCKICMILFIYTHTNTTLTIKNYQPD